MCPDHRPRKRFGQHFLTDKNIIGKIIDIINPESGDTFLEIGPGHGALTEPLLDKLSELHVVEVDRDLAHEMVTKYSGSNKLIMHCQNILDIKLDNIFPASVRVVGNLPYNISTPLLFSLLDQLDKIINMVFMLQEEVVDRLCASPGSKTYGRLSVMVQSKCRIEKMLSVPASCFKPPPRVTSAIVRLTPLEHPVVSDQEYPVFKKIVRECFNQRRKTLRNALKSIADEEDFSKAGILATARAEELTVQQFANLANQLQNS